MATMDPRIFANSRPAPQEDALAADRAIETMFDPPCFAILVSGSPIPIIPAELGAMVTLDLHAVMASSLAFLDAHAPSRWSAALRAAFSYGLLPSDTDCETITRVLSLGFTRAILLPGVDTQGMTTIETTGPDPKNPTTTITARVSERQTLLTGSMEYLLNTCSNMDGLHPLPGLLPNDPDQYTAPYVGESMKTPILPPRAPSRARPYLLLYSPGPIPQDSKNKTFSEADAWLAALSTTLSRSLTSRGKIPLTLTSMTNAEAELLQRREAEARALLTKKQRTNRYGDSRIHAFNAWDNDSTKSNWSWNLASRVPGGCGFVSWDPKSRRSDRAWVNSSYRSPRLGARPAVVVTL